MTTRQQILLGMAIGALLCAISEIVERGPIVFLVTSCILVGAALLMGPRLEMIYRVALVTVITFFTYCMTLQGRTMSVGLNLYTIQFTAIYYALFGMPLNLILFRIFQRPATYWVMALSGFIAIAAALTVASIEEFQFITNHQKTGIGPTSRWTISHHWMSYDAENRRLEGSD